MTRDRNWHRRNHRPRGGAMARMRRHRNHRVSLLLSLAWLPLVVLQCPNCPDVATRLIRCTFAITNAKPAPSAPADAHKGCHGEHRRDESQQQSCGDCCGAVTNLTTTVGGPASSDLPPPSFVAWTLPAIPLSPGSTPAGSIVPVEHKPHSPPTYLACCSLLL